VKVLAKGSSGVVHLARRKRDGREYAIKQVALRDYEPSKREEVIAEARALTKLNSPYVAYYHDCIVEDDQLNIVMQYLSNGTARDLLANTYREGMPESLVWQFFLQCLKGLQYMHSRGIIHRDITTENIFLDAQFNAQIGDLGIAQRDTETAYKSRDVLSGEPCSESSDVHALGVCLYEFMMGKNPFQGKNEEEVKKNVMHRKYEKVGYDLPYSKKLVSLVNGLVRGLQPPDGQALDANYLLEMYG
tara:strand:- start:207 stop:944 length:738 start_codon:yes stop_codon:yes gene_type:complete